jgi:hypothetical protein
LGERTAGDHPIDDEDHEARVHRSGVEEDRAHAAHGDDACRDGRTDGGEGAVDEEVRGRELRHLFLARVVVQVRIGERADRERGRAEEYAAEQRPRLVADAEGCGNGEHDARERGGCGRHADHLAAVGVVREAAQGPLGERAAQDRRGHEKRDAVAGHAARFGVDGRQGPEGAADQTHRHRTDNADGREFVEAP